VALEEEYRSAQTAKKVAKEAAEAERKRQLLLIHQAPCGFQLMGPPQLTVSADGDALYLRWDHLKLQAEGYVLFMDGEPLPMDIAAPKAVVPRQKSGVLTSKENERQERRQLRPIEAAVLGLQPETEYRFTVAAKNQYGTGPCTDPPLVLKTAEAPGFMGGLSASQGVKYFKKKTEGVSDSETDESDEELNSEDED
jgi:hypothetical protein